MAACKSVLEPAPNIHPSPSIRVYMEAMNITPHNINSSTWHSQQKVRAEWHEALRTRRCAPSLQRCAIKLSGLGRGGYLGVVEQAVANPASQMLYSPLWFSTHSESTPQINHAETQSTNQNPKHLQTQHKVPKQKTKSKELTIPHTSQHTIPKTHSESTPENYIINSTQLSQKPYPPTNCFELFIFENNLNQSNYP